MKVSCLQENLSHALGLANRIVPSRTMLPVLTHVLLATDHNRLKITASNLEISLTCSIGAKVEADGAIAIPARMLSALVSLLPDEQVELESNQQTETLHLRCSRTESQLKGQSADFFPSIPSFDASLSATLSVATLKKLIAQSTFAATTDESRPNLTGVFAKIEDRQITMVATDGYRLSLSKETLQSPLPSDTPVEILIPARALAEFTRALSDQNKERPVTIAIAPPQKQVLFRTDNVEAVIQLLEQKFPPYESVIPKHWGTRVVVNTSEFLNACRQAAIFAHESSNMARLTVKHDDGHVLVNARAAQSGENTTALEAEITGAGLEIALNVQFLIEALGVVNTSQVALEMTTPKNPVTLRPIGDESFLHIIMPMHIG